MKTFASRRFGRYVKLAHRGRGAWQVVFHVGVQSFDVGPAYPNKSEAAWYRTMVCIALQALVSLEEKS